MSSSTSRASCASAFGRALIPRVLDVMEARSAVILRQLSRPIPRLSIADRSSLPSARAGFCASRHATEVPVTVVRALVRPTRARCSADGSAPIARRTAGRARDARRRPSGWTSSERTLRDDCVPMLPRVMPAAAVGLAMLGARRRSCSARMRAPTSCRRCCAACRTTSRPRWTSRSGRWPAASARTATPPRSLRDGSADDLAARFRAGTLPAVAQRGLAEFLSRYGHRAVAEIDIGMPRWSDDPRHILGVLANYLRLEDATTAPDAVFARGAAEAEAMIETLAARAARRSRAARAAGAVRARPRARARRTARAAEVQPDRRARRRAP